MKFQPRLLRLSLLEHQRFCCAKPAPKGERGNLRSREGYGHKDETTIRGIKTAEISSDFVGACLGIGSVWGCDGGKMPGFAGRRGIPAGRALRSRNAHLDVLTAAGGAGGAGICQPGGKLVPLLRASEEGILWDKSSGACGVHRDTVRNPAAVHALWQNGRRGSGATAAAPLPSAAAGLLADGLRDAVCLPAAGFEPLRGAIPHPWDSSADIIQAAEWQ